MPANWKTRVLRAIAWFFAVFFLFGGITYVLEHILSCILLCLTGILCLPPLADFMKRKKLYFPLWLRIVLILILYVITSYISPKTYV